MSKKKKLLRNQIICLVSLSIATVLFVFGGWGLSTGDSVAPWLMVAAALMVAPRDYI